MQINKNAPEDVGASEMGARENDQLQNNPTHAKSQGVLCAYCGKPMKPAGKVWIRCEHCGIMQILGYRREKQCQ